MYSHDHIYNIIKGIDFKTNIYEYSGEKHVKLFLEMYLEHYNHSQMEKGFSDVCLFHQSFAQWLKDTTHDLCAAKACVHFVVCLSLQDGDGTVNKIKRAHWGSSLTKILVID